MFPLLSNSLATHLCSRQPGYDPVIKYGARVADAPPIPAPDDRSRWSDHRDRGDFAMARCCRAKKRFAPRGARSRGGTMINAS